MSEEFDPFAPGSNLKENFDGVVRCVFEKSENNDNYNAHMYIVANDGEEVETFLSLGKDWVSYDGGKSVEHPRGDATRFNAQTTYSEWITFAMGGYEGELNDPDTKPAGIEKGLGAAAVLRERNRQLGNRGPQIAALWDDLSFHFDVLKRHGRSRVVTKTSDGERVEWLDVIQDRMMPVRFLGAGGQGRLDIRGGGATAASSPPAAPAAPATATPRETEDRGANGSHPALEGLSDDDKDALIDLAKSQSFGDFVDRVMALPTTNGGTMLEQSKVIQALSDEGFYTTLRG